VTTKQWISLGDSFAMSVQVDEQDSFGHHLGQSQKVHIWNAGVDGYSTWQATRRLNQLTEHLDIDKVVLVFFTGNDFQDNERFLAMRQMKLPGNPGDPIPRQPTNFWVSFLLKYSYVYAHYRIWEKQQAVLSGQDHSRQNWQDELKIFSAAGQGRLRHLKQQSIAALKELKGLCQEKNIPLMVAVAPPAFVIDQERIEPTFNIVGLSEVKKDIEAPQLEAMAILKQLKINACDLTKALREGEKKAPTYFTYDGHWTPHGHRIVADELQRCMGGEK